MPSRARVSGASGVKAPGLIRRSRPSAIDRGTHSAQLVEIQRARLIAGAVCAIVELGYAQTTVGHITHRASVSRRTFYELFANREECLAAVLEDLVGQIGMELAAADLDGLPWRERVRTGLWAVLSFFDREPALARVCVVQALRGGPRVLERREEILAGLVAVVGEGCNEGPRGGECTPLTAEGLVGAAFGIVYARLLRGEQELLTGLLGELMGMIVLPYLGPAAARREHARPVPALPGAPRVPSRAAPTVAHPLDGIRMRLTYRTARVLEGVAVSPGASNRTIGEYAGVFDAGQISKLLARLERVGLLANTGEGHAKGEPNAWTLTPREYRAFSLDLSRGIEAPFEQWQEEGERYERRLSPEAPREFDDIFMWNEGVSGFQPLVTSAAPDTQHEKGTEPGRVKFVGASPDLKHVVFESKERALTATAPEGTENLYEWADGTFKLVNVLPDGKTTIHEENGHTETGLGLGFYSSWSEETPGMHDVSGDGSRVIWSHVTHATASDLTLNHIYESDMSTGKSVQVDAPQGVSSLPENEGQEALFQTASADGSKVFFTSDAPLTSSANTGPPEPQGSREGSDLYVFDAVTGGLTDLTPDHNASDTCQPGGFKVPIPFCGAQVQGVIGASENGTSVYFVANGVLAAGASPGDCRLGHAEEVGYSGAACNLYLAHFDGSSWTTTFIARLSGEDEPDWRSHYLTHMLARVSPNGRYLAFVSLKSLTGYDNLDSVSGQPDFEVYLYDASGAGRLVCVSCNPTGSRPTGQENLRSLTEVNSMDPEGALGGNRPYWLSGMVPAWSRPNREGEGAIHQPRYLSDEGRLFFDSAEALVAQDTNGRVDVYEYEPEGVGSCEDEAGCIYLISGGTGSKDSTFVDASASGNDVFFISESQLVSQDTDNAYDMYDAHACTVASPCFAVSPVLPPACTSADACRPGPTPQPPIFGAPASATFTGPGNPAQAASTPPAAKKKSAKKPKAKGRRSKQGRGGKRKRARRSRVPVSSGGRRRR